MELLTQIKAMPWPQFLLFYAVIAGACLLLARSFLLRLDRTGQLPPLTVPSNPDPYEIAYLRGGDNEVTRVAIASLTQQRYLRVTAVPRDGKTDYLIVGTAPGTNIQHPIEREVHRWFASPTRAKDIFANASARLTRHTLPYRDNLTAQQLLAPSEQTSISSRLTVALGLTLLGIVALRSWPNPFFMIVGCIGLFWLCTAILRTPRVSERGRNYLGRLQSAFASLRHTGLRSELANRPAGPDAPQLPFHTSAAVPALLLGVGLFGMGVLGGTAHASLLDAFPKAGHPSDGGGACGGCGGDCGGCGCGGCGD